MFSINSGLSQVNSVNLQNFKQKLSEACEGEL